MDSLELERPAPSARGRRPGLPQPEHPPGVLRSLDAWLDGRPLEDATLATYLGELHEQGRAPASAATAVAAACYKAEGRPVASSPVSRDRGHRHLRGSARAGHRRSRCAERSVSAVTAVTGPRLRWAVREPGRPRRQVDLPGRLQRRRSIRRRPASATPRWDLLPAIDFGGSP